jgi:hypothetical protein
VKNPYKSKTEIAIYNRREVNGHLEPSSHHKYVLFTKNDNNDNCLAGISNHAWCWS